MHLVLKLGRCLSVSDVVRGDVYPLAWAFSSEMATGDFVRKALLLLKMIVQGLAA